jgi:hypothetical protein
VKSAVAAAFARAEKASAASSAMERESDTLAEHGFLGAAPREAARLRALREVVLPCAKALLGQGEAVLAS